MEKGLKAADAGTAAESAAKPGRDASAYSPLVLAYIGDAVYELLIRTMTVEEGNRQVNKIHHETVHYVKAETQARLARHLEPLLTAEELAAWKHGRNAHPHTAAKHASVIDYRMATAFEALLGFLWMNGRKDRVEELVSEGLRWLKREEAAATDRNHSVRDAVIPEERNHGR